MRIRYIILSTVLSVSFSLQASEQISPDTLDQTMSDAKNAVAEENYTQAFELYSKAAHWGHKGAQYILGELYMMGKGVARDPVVGYAWLEVAAESRVHEIVRARNQAKKELSDKQRTEAEALAVQIEASYGLTAAGVTCKREIRTGTNIKRINCYHHNLTATGELIVPSDQEILSPAS